jgi:hypothetical protein
MPDWGATSAPTTVYKLEDLGELAARLGSIDTFDRRGDVLLLEDFESGLARWMDAGAGTGNTVDLSMTGARSGLFSCRLVAGSTGDAEGAIRTVVPIPAITRIGLEVKWTLPTDYLSFDLVLLAATGSRILTAACRFLDALNAIQYQASDGSWVTLEDSPGIPAGAYAWSTFKIVVDLEDEEYARIIVNESSWSPVGAAVPAIDSAQTPYVIVQLELHGQVGSNAEIRVDDVIVTQNEP